MADLDTSPVAAGGLSLAVGSRKVLHGISFALPAQGITVLMGPNGAGKSLLLQALHGLGEPVEGGVSVYGKPLDAQARLTQAMVFQKPVLLRRSVGANVDFALKARGRKDAALRDRLLEDVGLLPLSRQPARRLSGGEAQRLAIARALATGPDVLFMDEPTANLDPGATLRIEEIVQEIAARGVKVVFVTHDVGQAQRLASDVLFIASGRLTEHTPADAFFAEPRSIAARDYLAGRIVL